MKDAPYYSPIHPFSLDRKQSFDFSLVSTAIAVTIFHFFLVGLGVYFPTSQSKPAIHQKVIVKTVTLHPKESTSVSLSNPIVPMVEEIDRSIAFETNPPTITRPAPVPVSEPKPIIEAAAPSPPPKKEVTSIPSKTVTPPKEVKLEKKLPSKQKPAAPVKKTPEKTPVSKVDNKAAAKAAVKAKVEDVDKAKLEAKKQTERAKEAEQKLVAEEKARQQKIMNENIRQKMALVKENLTKVEQTSDKIKSTNENISSTSTGVSGALAASTLSLQIDALPTGTAMPIELSVREVNYRDEISTRVIRALALPEHGSGTIRLTIERSGKIDRVEVVESESARNKEFILKNLPNLRFPSFENRFKDAPKYTFIIKFNN